MVLDGLQHPGRTIGLDHLPPPDGKKAGDNTNAGEGTMLDLNLVAHDPQPSHMVEGPKPPKWIQRELGDIISSSLSTSDTVRLSSSLPT